MTTLTTQPWPPLSGQQVNYYGSITSHHGPATVLGPAYSLGPRDFRWRIRAQGRHLYDVRTQSIHPIYVPEVTPEQAATARCVYCGTIRPVIKSGRLRSHLLEGLRCQGAGRAPRFTIGHEPHPPYCGKPWHVSDELTQANMCHPQTLDPAERNGWFRTYAEAYKAMIQREREGWLFSGDCSFCGTVTESKDGAYRHAGTAEIPCIRGYGRKADPRPQNLTAVG